jgi:hypothetical protein
VARRLPGPGGPRWSSQRTNGHPPGRRGEGPIGLVQPTDQRARGETAAPGVRARWSNQRTNGHAAKRRARGPGPVVQPTDQRAHGQAAAPGSGPGGPANGPTDPGRDRRARVRARWSSQRTNGPGTRPPLRGPATVGPANGPSEPRRGRRPEARPGLVQPTDRRAPRRREGRPLGSPSGPPRERPADATRTSRPEAAFPPRRASATSGVASGRAPAEPPPTGRAGAARCRTPKGVRYTRTDGGRLRSNMCTVSTKRTCFSR